MGKYNRPTKQSKEVESHEEDAEVYQQVGTFDKLPKPHLKIVPKAKKMVKEIQQIKPEAEVRNMNIYQKLQTIRKEVAELDIQRSSRNEDKGFSYLELPDYLPQINKLNSEYGLFTHFNMDDSEAVLKITNADKPEEVLEWTLPVQGYEMEDAQKIQILKGTTTYMRRALFEIAYEISVKDTVDSQGKKTTPEIKPEEELDPRDLDAIKEATELEQLNTICQSIRQRKGFNKNQALLKHYTTKKDELTKEKTQ
jgi:hypothetical protein